MTTLFPDVLLEFSPSTAPFETPVWEDITPYLRSFSMDRGRSNELDRAEAGVATFVIDNFLGYFDPAKLDSPYYPGITPMRRVRISAFVPAEFEPFTVGSSFLGGSDVLGGSLALITMFAGFVESWTNQWTPEPSPTADATATLRGVDAFKALAYMHGVVSNTGDSGSMVGLILDHGSWPADERNIETGTREVRGVPADDANALKLGVLQDIDAAEGGLFFVARDGKVTFYGSDHVALNPPSANQVWGDATDERQYQSITFESNESALANVITLTSPYVGGTGFARDTTSESMYLQRRLDASMVLMQLADLQDRAEEYLERIGTPKRQITRLEVAVRDDVEWTDILSKDLLDRIVVKRRPYPGDPGVTQDSTIQRISIHSESQRQWSVVWTLSATPGT